MKRFLFALALLCLAPLARAGSYSTPQMSFPAQNMEANRIAIVYPPTFDRTLGTLDSVQLGIDRFGGLVSLPIYNWNPWPGSVLFSDPANHPAQLWLRAPEFSHHRPLVCIVPPKRVLVPPMSSMHIIQTAACYGIELPPSSDPALLALATTTPVSWALHFSIGGWVGVPTTTSGGPFMYDFGYDPPYLAKIGATVHVVYTYH